MLYTNLTLVETFVRNCQFLTSFAATCSQYFTSVLSCHAATESVLVSSLSYRRLKRSFHDLSLYSNVLNAFSILEMSDICQNGVQR